VDREWRPGEQTIVELPDGQVVRCRILSLPLAGLAAAVLPAVASSSCAAASGWICDTAACREEDGHGNPAHRMLSSMTGRPPAGQSPGVQSGGLGLPRSTPVNSSPGSDTGAAAEGDPISAIAAPGADGRTAPVATAFPSTAAGEPDPVLLAGDLPTERHRLPARVTRYWRWRAFYSSLPLVVLLISGAIVLPWGPWWVRWGIVGVFVAVIAAGLIILPPIRYRVFWYAISSTEIDIQNGIIFTTRSVVPMRRVQTLLTERGPMADHYRLTNLKIRTAAGSVGLSGLDRGEADELCDRIARLTDLADDV
jgi:membrane protein YdbS with pleckstrin-like domain